MNDFQNSSFDLNDLELVREILNKEIVADAVQTSYEYVKLMSYYRCAMMEIETKFNVLNEEFSLHYDRQPISSIKTRLKKPASIIKKLNRHNITPTVSNIEKHLNDVAGVRVVCSFVEDVYTLANALKRQDDIEIIIIKDYISSPKENGYRSLHLIVSVPIFLEQEKRPMKVEVQLRTIAMDFWASLEHQLRYKKNVSFTDEMTRELRYCADLSAELDRRMDVLRDTVSEECREKSQNDLFEYLTNELLS